MIFKLLVLALVAIFIYIRFAPLQVASFHQKPSSAPSQGKMNEFRLVGDDAPVFLVSEDDLMENILSLFGKQPSTRLVAGSVEEGFVTFVQRSKLLGYPDYISMEVMSQGDNQTRLEIFSRSKFGYSDFGVNHKRVDMWIEMLTKQLKNKAKS